jgi:hypothetical protein
MKHIEAAKQALEALEDYHEEYPPLREVGYMENLITALRQAIEQAEKQEPFWFAVVSNMSPVINKAIKSEEIAHEYADKCRANYDCDDLEVVPLYTSPPPRQPLTDEEIEFIYADTGYNDIQMFARAIEAAHGIKENT